jgi:hypothetical protein
MSCGHDNPPGNFFCRVCGEAIAHRRCQCGAAVGPDDTFCGRCGIELTAATAAVVRTAVRGDANDGRFSLEQMLAMAREENRFLETHKAYVTQDDIRKLVAKRKKKAK